MNIVDGRKISNTILEDLKTSIAKNDKKPGLAVIQVAEDAASTIYVNKKREVCTSIGMQSFAYNLPEDATEKELTDLIHELNQNDAVHGIMVQFPLPKGLNSSRICSYISPQKDVDGLTPISLGNIITKDYNYMAPCTPQAVMLVLEHIKAELVGTNVTILGASAIVGKPLAVMLINQKATVTVCHHETKDLESHIKNADILISAIGKTGVIDSSWIKQGAIVLDIGINRQNDTVVGDVDFDSAKYKAKWITPVPGGIGPVTVAMLMLNTFKAFSKHAK